MTYTILGRAIKNEHLALAVLASTFGGAWLSTRGGKSQQAPIAGQSIQAVKESVPINASSSDEEQFIKDFIAEAEKGDAKH